MSLYGSQQGLNISRKGGSKSDLTGVGTYPYSRSEVMHGGGNGYDHYGDGYRSFSYSKSTRGSTGGGMMSGTQGGMMMGSGMSGGMIMGSGTQGGMMVGSGTQGGMMVGSGTQGGMMVGSGMAGGMSASNLSAIHQKALNMQAQCQEYLKKAEFALQSGPSGDAERYMMMAKETIEQLKNCAIDLRHMGHSNDNIVRTLELCKDQLKGVHMAITGSMRRRSTRGSSGGWEEPGRSFHDAIAWIGQQKRLIETASWGDDPATIQQQLVSHQKFHSSIQRSVEVDRARDDLNKRGDKGNLHALDQEWDSLQQLSFQRTQQLQELQQIIQEISKEIMWVNDREEEELVFDWGDKNIDQYIPRKQESYSTLMSALEVKEKELNKLKTRVDTLLKNNHPAADKIEAYQDTLQTQWSWLLQITKCIDTHLKENAAYSQFFKEANETYSALQKEHETVRKRFICDKNTPLENLLEILKGLEREKERIMDNKRQVQHLVNKSKSIVRLKPRNPEEKSSTPVIVKALCDFKQDQKVICKDNEAILKDNSQRSRWDITGPGGLDMLVPSVCLIIPPPNPLSVSLANKNEQYYEAILSIWNQLYINIKSLIAWQYCLTDIHHINSLTISMLAKMRPEEYRQIIKNLETHYEEFKRSSLGSQMFADDDKRSIENQFTEAQSHYDQLVVQLPTYVVQFQQDEAHQAAREKETLLLIQQQAAADAEAWRLEEEARRLEEERLKAERRKQAEKKANAKKEQVIKKEVVKVTKSEQGKKKVVVSSSASSPYFSSISTSNILSELHALRLRLEGTEGTLSQHVHICVGDEGVHDCGLRISQLETVHSDIDSMREEFLHLREQILRELEDMNDPDKAQFLRSELGIINQRLGSLESSASAYLQRLRALRDMLESVARAEDIVKVHEARLTEKETTSLSPQEVEEYLQTLKKMKAELDQKRDVLSSMEAEFSKASHWNGQVGGAFHRCDMMLSKYKEQVGQLSDRWRRIQGQIDTRHQDLQLYLPQLQHYRDTSDSLSKWIDDTKRKQENLRSTKIKNVETLKDHINKQKELNSEIKSRRETLESVLKDNEACVNSVKDHEIYLTSYTSGLETLLNIPFKRTMLRSPSMDLNQEATQLQTRYMELLTLSAEYYKFLGELMKNMEELKIRNTRIDLLEEELRRLKEDIHDRNNKNKSLEDAVSRYQVELSHSQDQLLLMEESKRSSEIHVSATREKMDTTQSRLSDLEDQVNRLTYLLEEEKRKRRLAEERYTQQQEEFELVLRKRQKEYETVSWSKVELEKSSVSRDHELEQLRRQLADEAARNKELQKEISKVRSDCSAEINNLKVSYESQIHVSRTDIQRLTTQREENTAELQQRCEWMEAEKRNLEEELRKLRMSISQAEEQKAKAEEEVHSQRLVITEESRRRRELENEVEVLMKQRDQNSNQLEERLAEVMNALREKSEQLEYVTHSLEEETRRRKTAEEGHGVLEQSLSQLQVKLTNSSIVSTQLRECEVELQTTRIELERERKERSRIEQNLSRLQSRIKDLQAVRDSLESQVENLRKTNQEEAARRSQAEAELEKTAMSVREYTSTIAVLRQCQEEASTSGKRDEEEWQMLHEELERSLKQNKAYIEQVTQLRSELQALQQQLLQEQARLKEANLRNEELNRSIKEKIRVLDENSLSLRRLQEATETHNRERLKLEEELKTTKQDKEKLLRSKQGSEDEFSSQITALDLQLKASERSNLEYRTLISELSSEREKLKLETERIQRQATEITSTMQSTQSQYTEVVKERDTLLLKLQFSDKDKDRFLSLEEELRRIKMSLESELRSKQQLQEEIERLRRDSSHWKDQYESKQTIIRQYDTDKDRMEREKNSLKSEIERLMRELRELESLYKSKLAALQKELHEVTVVRQTMETELKSTRVSSTLDASNVIFDGVRKSVTADQLLDCGVLDKPTLTQLVKGQRSVPEVAADKKINLKGTGPIAGVIVQDPKSPGSSFGQPCKLTLTEAKTQNLLPPDCADLLLDAQAATGHIIDPRTNQKFTVEDACNQGVVDLKDRQRLLAAEAAAVGYRGPGISKPLSAFEAMKKGLIDKNTTLRLLQAQECVGGILDPVLSVFLPKDTAIERNLINDDIYRTLNQRPELYLDPESEEGATYMSLKRRCKVEPQTGLLLLPVSVQADPSKFVFDGVRKTVTAKELLDCGVLDKKTFDQLRKGEKTIQEVSEDKKLFLKGKGPIAGVAAGPLGKMALSEAKQKMFMSTDSADLLLDAQAATGHIIDPAKNKKLTVEEACAHGVVDNRDRDRLLAAEAAAVGYRDPGTGMPLSLYGAMKKGLVDRKTGLRLLQAQESAGGILDPNLSVFLPRETAINRNLLDKDICNVLDKNPVCYIDPDTETEVSYVALKKKCKTESHTGLILLPIIERKDPSKIMFEGVRKPVSAQQLFACGVLDKPTLDQLVRGDKSVQTVSVEKTVFLKGTGPISGVVAGHKGKMSLAEAKKQNLLPDDSAYLLLEAQAATGHIIEPSTGEKLTVEEACAKGVVDVRDKIRLLSAEGAAVGYKDPSSAKLLSVFEAMRKGIIDKKVGLRYLQAQESVGGILDPNLSVFLPKNLAIKHNLLDEELCQVLKLNPACYLDPEPDNDVSYGALKGRCKKESHTGLQLLPISERFDPSKLLFEGVRKTVTAKQLLDCGVLDQLTFNKLIKGEKTVSELSVDKRVYLKGTGSIAGVAAGSSKKLSFTEAKKQDIMDSNCANMLLEAQAATGHIIDPKSNQKLTVKEASAKGVVAKEDESKLFAAEAAAIGYRDPNSTKLLSAGHALRMGLIDKDTALRILQAQESVGGILDPSLSVFLPRESALNRGLIDENLNEALNQYPECYLDPVTQKPTTYISLKRQCKADPFTGLLFLSDIATKKSDLTVQGLRGEVSVSELVDANLLEASDICKLSEGKLTSKDIEERLHSYLRGSTCIAGVYDEASDKVMPIYQAMKNKLLRPGTTLELLEAQAASGFIIDPVNNLYLSVSDAYSKRLFGPEFKDKLLSAERAVTGYKMPGTNTIISLFQAIEKGLIEKGHGIRLLEAQIASGGIIDPEHSHRIDVDVAYKKGYFDENMNKILTDESDDTKGFFDPNTEENLTYLELKSRCITDKNTGLVLLPIVDPKKLESTLKNTLRKRRVVIVDPETNREMTVREAYDKGYIDYETYLDLSQQEGEWEEITITAPDGSVRFVINDKKTGRQFDINDLLEKKIINQSVVDKYRSNTITLTELADIITEKTKHGSLSSSSLSGSRQPASTSFTSSVTSSSSVKKSESSGSMSLTSSDVPRPSSPSFGKMTTTRTTMVTERSSTISAVSRESPDSLKHKSSVSITLASPVEAVGEQEPVGAIFDTEAVEKISITEALNRGLVDSITAQRLLEAQACTGGIVNPANGNRLSIQEASRLGLINDDMANNLKSSQKAYTGFEDVKTRKKISVAQAMKEMWLPYEAGNRFMEFQYVTGGLYDPEANCRRSIEDALNMGWLDVSAAQKLADVRHHTKNLTCPKSKLKISYKEALDNCLAEESSGVRMLQASSVSSRGISSPYNAASAPGSTSGSRSGSRRSSRRSSFDLGSSTSSPATLHSHSSFANFFSR